MKKLIIILLLSIPALGYGQAKYLKIGIDTAATRDWSRAYLKLFNPYLLDSSWIKGNIRNIITNGTGGLGLPENTTGETVIIGLTSNNIPILFTGVDDTTESGSTVQLADDILRFNVEKYTPYLSKPTGLGLYVSSETPTGTLPLKLNGNFYATKLFASDIEIQGNLFPTTNSPLNIYTESLANNDFLLYSTANTRWENKTVSNVLNLLIPDQTGNGNKILKTNGTSLLWGAETSLTNGLLEFSGSTFAPYAAFSANNFYTGTTNPTGTTRLNIDRNLWATKVYSGGTEILPHNPVTIGTANGLSLSTQALSLGLSSTSTTGALSNTDWNTFNNKVTFPGFGTTVTTAANGNHLHTGVYQPLLVSGTNIRRINGQDITGSGEITVTATGVETDPIFTAHAANGITSTNITDWTNKVSFPGFGTTVSTAAYGNHVHGNYLPFYTGTTNPTGTTRYNVNGHLYATRLYSNTTIVSPVAGSTGIVVIPESNAAAGISMEINGTTVGMGIGSFSSSPAVQLTGYSTGSPLNIENQSTGTAIDIKNRSSGIPISIKNQTFDNIFNVNSSGDVDISGKYKFEAGNSSTFAVAGGTLKDFYTDASTSGTTETDLYSYAIPANVLVNNGDKIESEFVFTGASTTGVTIRPYFASSDIGGDYISLTPVSLGSGRGELKIKIVRVSSSTARVFCNYFIHGGSIYQAQNYIELTSKNWTVVNILKFTAQANVGVATAKFGVIKYFPAGAN